MGRLTKQLSFSNVVSVLALFIALGGSAFAVKAAQKDSVTSKSIRDGAIKPKDIKGGATNNGYQASGSVNFDTFSASLFGSTVVTLEVPPGSYFVTSSAEVQSVNAVPSNVQCRLINGEGGAGSSGISRVQIARDDGGTDDFTLTALLEVTEGQALNLQCSKDVPGASARVPNASIVAVRIGKVTGSP